MEAKDHRERNSALTALALGAAGGLLLGAYLWRGGNQDHRLSGHLASLSKLVEEMEKIDLEESEVLKERIEHLLKTIESSYGKS